LLDLLSAFPEQQFVVYGSGQEGVRGNLQFKAFSSDGFLRDLAACRSVIATAGFTLISEALYLGKPYLAMPMHGQFEQQLNALCLEEIGCGLNAGVVNHDVIKNFFDCLPSLSTVAENYSSKLHAVNPGQANAAICSKLDELLSAVSDAPGAVFWQR